MLRWLYAGVDKFGSGLCTERQKDLYCVSMPPKRRKKFTRDLDATSPESSPDKPLAKKRVFIPPSPERRRVTRSVKRQKPSCLVFGPLREVVYSDFFLPQLQDV
jgi:hypothetical protein